MTSSGSLLQSSYMWKSYKWASDDHLMENTSNLNNTPNLLIFFFIFLNNPNEHEESYFYVVYLPIENGKIHQTKFV